MLKLLIKRQLSELFRGYFFDTKKNKARSRSATIGMIIAFVILSVGAVGGAMFMMSKALCEPFVYAGMSWMYFFIMGTMALFMGIVGGVFSAYTNLYKAKDNDLLLSMPIPPSKIITARILSVYLLSALFSVLVILPALIVYWVTTGFTVWKLAGGLLFSLAISLLALSLSSLLGFVVAKVGSRLKNRSVIIVLLSLGLIILYYVVYFLLQKLIMNMVSNPESFMKLGEIPGIKIFGEAGVPKLTSLLVVLAVTAALLGVVMWMLVRSFRRIISESESVSRVKYKEKVIVQRSVKNALLGREWRRFAASPGYILNGAIGSFMLVAMAALLFWRGGDFFSGLRMLLDGETGTMTVLGCAIICFVAGTNLVSTPSVSLEGKTLWLIRSLPVETRSVLLAKLKLHCCLTMPPTLLASLAVWAAVRPGLAEALFIFLLPQVMVLFLACLGLMLGTVRANLNWTNEMVPVKSSLNVMLSMFAGMAYGIALGGLYMWFGRKIGTLAYLIIFTGVTLLLTAAIFFWIGKRGVEKFEEL